MWDAAKAVLSNFMDLTVYILKKKEESLKIQRSELPKTESEQKIRALKIEKGMTKEKVETREADINNKYEIKHFKTIIGSLKRLVSFTNY